MPQLDLKLSPKLVYTSNGFMVHKGVSEARESILSGVQSSKWQMAFVYGEPRSGKTHLSIKLSSDLEALGLDSALIEGKELKVPDFAKEHTVVLVDDIERLDTKGGNSGEFVNFCEELKNKGAFTIFFSSTFPTNLPFDDHIRSRLRAAVRFNLEPPGEGDVEELLYRMSLQRGVKITGRKLGFATKRVGRDIASLEAFVERVKSISRRSGEKIRFQAISEAI